MKLQRTTLILVLLALSLGGFVYFYEVQWKSQQEEVKEKTQQIFSFNAADVESLKIKTNKLTIELERNHTSEHPTWLIKSPEQAPALDAYVSYLMDLLVKGKSDRTLSIPATQLGEFGLDNPQATIDIKLKNQKTHQLILGKPDFNQHFLYAEVDSASNYKPNANINVLLVSPDFQNAVNRDLSEWKQPSTDNSGTPLPPLPSIPQPSPTSESK